MGTRKFIHFICDPSTHSCPCTPLFWRQPSFRVSTEIAIDCHSSSPRLQDLLTDSLDVLKAVKAADVIDQDVGVDAPESPAAGVCPLLQHPGVSTTARAARRPPSLQPPCQTDTGQCSHLPPALPTPPPTARRPGPRGAGDTGAQSYSLPSPVRREEAESWPTTLSCSDLEVRPV